MKMKYTQMALALTMCLGSIHGRAQNVTARALEAQVAFANPKIDLNLIEALSKSSKPWESSAYANENKETGLKSIFDKTNAYLKQPQRGQSLGGLDGGGGNALICESVGKFTSQLLDLYETEELNIKVDFGPGQSFLEKIEYVLSRLAKVSPLRATIYRAMALDLLTKNTQWVKNTSMPVINDVKLATIPRGCLLVQVAVQRPLDQANLPNAKTFIIDQDMFYLLNEDSKAALVLHEILYREARHSGLSDSVFTRHFLGLILSEEVSKHSRASLNKILVENNVKCSEGLSAPVFYEINDVKSCKYLDKLNYSFKGEISLNLPNYQINENSFSNGYKLKTTGKFKVIDEISNEFLDNIGTGQNFNFEGNLQIESSSKGLKTFTFPGVEFRSGFVRVGLKEKESKNNESNLNEDIFIPLPGILDIRNFISMPGDLGKNLATFPELVGKNLKPFIAFEGEFEIKSHFIKLVNSSCVKSNRCEYEKDKLAALVLFEGNEMSINPYSPNNYFLVYIGESSENETKNGWKKAHAISFQGDKISSVKYMKMEASGKLIEKVIKLMK